MEGRSLDEAMEVERYWKIQIELISALIDDIAFSSLAPPMVKTEQAESIFVVDVEGVYSSIM